MDESKIFPAKFMKFLIPERTSISTMTLPRHFCQKYRDFIPPKVTVVLRNGEEVQVAYVKELDQFVGMSQLFERFDCANGLSLAFQYNGGDNFWAHAISISTSTEVDGHIFDDGGCKFLNVFLSFSASWGLLKCPKDFVDRFGNEIPTKLIFRLSNGRILQGSFDHAAKGILGLQQVFRFCSMSTLDMLLFTYYGDGVFDVSAFGGSCVEKAINDETVYSENQLDFFEIEVKGSHVLQYCYGVYIPIKYRSLCNKWKEFDCIEVHHGTKKWCLEVKKRKKCVEIHRGWCDFRRDLQLRVGDYCVFKRGTNDRRFNVEVYKKFP